MCRRNKNDPIKLDKTKNCKYTVTGWKQSEDIKKIRL